MQRCTWGKRRTRDRMGPSARAPGAMSGAKKGMASKTSLLLNDIRTLPARWTGSCVAASRWSRLPMLWPKPYTGKAGSVFNRRMQLSSLNCTWPAIRRWLKPVAYGAATICSNTLWLVHGRRLSVNTVAQYEMQYVGFSEGCVSTASWLDWVRLVDEDAEAVDNCEIWEL